MISKSTRNEVSHYLLYQRFRSVLHFSRLKDESLTIPTRFFFSNFVDRFVLEIHQSTHRLSVLELLPNHMLQHLSDYYLRTVQHSNQQEKRSFWYIVANSWKSTKKERKNCINLLLSLFRFIRRPKHMSESVFNCYLRTVKLVWKVGQSPDDVSSISVYFRAKNPEQRKIIKQIDFHDKMIIHPWFWWNLSQNTLTLWYWIIFWWWQDELCLRTSPGSWNLIKIERSLWKLTSIYS